MSKANVSLPQEQAVWTRADVERHLNEKGPEAVFGRDALAAWAEKQNLIPAGNAPAVVRMPAAVVPELAAVTDPNYYGRDCASVYVDAKAGAAIGTDAKVMMRVAAVEVSQTSKPPVAKDLLSFIPKADGRTAYRFDAHILLRLCLSALASVGGDPTSRRHGSKVTIWPHPTDPAGVCRVEVSTDDNELRMVGCLMPMRIEGESPTTDPKGLLSELADKPVVLPAEATLLDSPPPIAEPDVSDL